MLRIRELRKRAGMTQKELCSIVGASEPSMSFYESGKQTPDIYMIQKIADTLGVTLDELVGIKPVPPEETAQPRTEEARILAKGIDKLSKEEREQALNVVRAMFAQYQDYFEKKEATNDPRP